jgi:4-amino-4-deoxy-L-arabinose transferase-like glycosyltransferase
MKFNQTVNNLWPYLIVLIPVIAGMFLDVMDIDSSQYAAISKEMYETGNYLQVYDHGKDYLDKPPLLFWMSSLMYSIFGVNHFVFRILPVLVSFLGVYATYRFTKMYYDVKSARFAALIFASCQAFFLMNHDVRTDTMLTGFTISAIWLLCKYIEGRKMIDLVLGFASLGMAMLAKGPIGLMVPVLGIGTHLLFKRKWKNIFDPKYLIGILIVLLMLLPMCIGLYLQFDAHSQKESGLYFYFWKQSFGRLTGENDWSNNPSPTFLAENFLWSFLPWTLLFLPAFVQKVNKLIQFKLHQDQEYVTLFGFLLPFVALSTSKYQLPHYIFILFPLASIVLGTYLAKIGDSVKILNRMKVAQVIIFILIITVFALLGFWSFPGVSFFLMFILLIIICSGLYFIYIGQDPYTGIILPSVIFIAGLNLFLNTHFYPEIFKYQSGSTIGRSIKSNPSLNPAKLVVMGKDLGFRSLDYYSDSRTPSLDDEIKLNNSLNDTLWLITDKEGLAHVNNLQNRKAEILMDTLRFHISTLNGKFLNPETRKEACDPAYLVKITPLLAK